jgi:protein-histidine N-methyltransferase
MDKYSIFINWLKKNGAEFPNLYFKEMDNNMRSVFTKQFIPRDQQIVTIPRKLLITHQMGRETKMGKRLVNKNVTFNSPKHAYIIVFMVEEMRKGNSFFQPYFDILPDDLSNFPIFWNKKELDMLKGSAILTQIKDRKNYLKDDYKRLIKAIPEFKIWCSYEKFTQLRTFVGSRNFGITIGHDRVGSMVPMSDMLNHKRPQMTSWTFNNEQQAFTITSKENINGKTELMDSYGIKAKSQFLLHYGFIPNNNIEPDGRDPNEVGLTEFPKEYGKSEVYLSLPLSKCSEIRRLLQFYYKKNNNHTHAISSLVNLLVKQLDQYPTTLKQDKKTLQWKNIPKYSNKHNALLLVSNEKEILQHYVDLFFKIIDVLEMDKSNRRKYLNKLPYNDEIRYYFNNIHPNLGDYVY